MVSAGPLGAVLSPIVNVSARCGRVTSSSGAWPVGSSAASDGTSAPRVPTVSCGMKLVPTPRHIAPDVTRWWPSWSSVVCDRPTARSVPGSGLPSSASAGLSSNVLRDVSGSENGATPKFGAGIGGTHRAGSLSCAGSRVVGSESELMPVITPRLMPPLLSCT